MVTLRPRAVVRGVGACASLFALVAFAAAAPARAQGGGTSATYDVTFATSGQSIWAPGGAGAGSATIDLTPDLTWDRSGVPNTESHDPQRSRKGAKGIPFQHSAP